MFYPKIIKLVVEVPAYKGRQDFKIEVNRQVIFEIQETKVSVFLQFFPPYSSSFHTNHKIGFNSQVRTLIRLKFSALVQCIQANCNSKPGVGGIFFLSLALFSFTLFVLRFQF